MNKPIDFGPLPPGSEISNYLYPKMDVEERTQDLVTIALPSGYEIHVGWFPEYNASGEYWIRVEWGYGELPDAIRTKSLEEVRSAVDSLVKLFSSPRVLRSSTTTENRFLEFSCN